MAGRTYEAFLDGEVIVHDLRRTVTETDNLLITTLTHNPQPLHLDAEYARRTEFGRVEITVVSKRRVSPTNTGAGMVTAS